MYLLIRPQEGPPLLGVSLSPSGLSSISLLCAQEAELALDMAEEVEEVLSTAGPGAWLEPESQVVVTAPERPQLATAGMTRESTDEVVVLTEDLPPMVDQQQVLAR